MVLTKKKLKIIHFTFMYFFSAIVTVICVYPFYNAIITSLQTGLDLFMPKYTIKAADIYNYNQAIFRNSILLGMLNSFIAAVLTVFVCLFLSVTAAFALGRIQFRGRQRIMFAILCVSMFPQVAILSGMFELIRFLGLYDTLGALILSYITFSLPFTVWMLTVFVRAIPKEIEEAAIMDGAGVSTIIRRIFVPLLAPAMVTTGLLAFIGTWNEFMFALTFIISDSQRTIPVVIGMIQGASRFELPWGVVMAASVIAAIPVLVIVAIFQKRIISGLTSGAVKG